MSVISRADGRVVRARRARPARRARRGRARSTSVGLALVHVDRAGVDRARARTPRRPCRAAARCRPRRAGPARRPRRGCRRGRWRGRRSVQNQPRGPAPQQPGGGERVDAAARASAPKSGRSASVSGSSAAAAHRCGAEHVRVVRVEDGRLDRRGRTAPRGGARGRCPAGRRGRRARRARPAPPRPARPACCHSEARVPGKPAMQHGVEAG